jgi:hypothetical protein
MCVLCRFVLRKDIENIKKNVDKVDDEDLECNILIMNELISEKIDLK